ncbi:hypothetical protein UFOVP703_56 [uncultured Caudovirales phage]|uniref:Uncharacterized protein n=1 Tax=uncultured Caudovirales phage TaxID=2100421 RepID=A0A6J5NPZ6_9CAUD|nr:hypothetical protein UFOVP703_56 [uncultured Caudovirales phage]
MDADRRQGLQDSLALREIVGLLESHKQADVVKALGTVRQALGDLVVVAERLANRPPDMGPGPLMVVDSSPPVFTPPRRERVKAIECKTDRFGRIERLELVWEVVPMERLNG